MPLTAISLQKVKRHVGGFGTPVGHNESHYPQMEKKHGAVVKPSQKRMVNKKLI